MLSVAILPVRRLTQLFILSLALSLVFGLAGGAVFSLALVLVLLHAHLFMFGLAVRCYNIFPLHMAFRLLELLPRTPVHVWSRSEVLQHLPTPHGIQAS